MKDYRIVNLKKKGKKKKKKALWIWKSKLPRHGQHVRAMSYIQFSKYTQFVEGNKQTRYGREICSNAVSNVLWPIDNGIISNRGIGCSQIFLFYLSNVHVWYCRTSIPRPLDFTLPSRSPCLVTPWLVSFGRNQELSILSKFCMLNFTYLPALAYC